MIQRQDFLDGMSRAASTVSVVTTDGPAGRAGVTVSAMTSVSADGLAPSLLACVHHKSATAKAVQRNGVFCVNVLRDEQAFISEVFASRRKMPSGDKFACADWRILKTGSPCLTDPLVAFDCRIRRILRYETHFVFIGAIEEMALSERGSPLVYTNRAYGATAPLETVRVKSLVADGDREFGQLEIGTYSTLGVAVLPALIKSFIIAHPAARVSLLEGDQDRLKAGLQDGEIETAFTYDLELGPESNSFG